MRVLETKAMSSGLLSYLQYLSSFEKILQHYPNPLHKRNIYNTDLIVSLRFSFHVFDKCCLGTWQITGQITDVV